MSNPQRDKGNRGERKIVDLLNQVPGVSAQRVPLSGAAGGAFAGDIRIAIDTLGVQTGEVKVRHDGFKQIRNWLEPVDVLFLLRDRSNPLVVMSFDLYAELLEEAIRAGSLRKPIERGTGDVSTPLERGEVTIEWDPSIGTRHRNGGDRPQPECSTSCPGDGIDRDTARHTPTGPVGALTDDPLGL